MNDDYVLRWIHLSIVFQFSEFISGTYFLRLGERLWMVDNVLYKVCSGRYRKRDG